MRVFNYPPEVYGIIYFLLIPIFAGIYSTIPSQFYQSTIHYANYNEELEIELEKWLKYSLDGHIYTEAFEVNEEPENSEKEESEKIGISPISRKNRLIKPPRGTYLRFPTDTDVEKYAILPKLTELAMWTRVDETNISVTSNPESDNTSKIIVSFVYTVHLESGRKIVIPMFTNGIVFSDRKITLQVIGTPNTIGKSTNEMMDTLQLSIGETANKDVSIVFPNVTDTGDTKIVDLSGRREFFVKKLNNYHNTLLGRSYHSRDVFIRMMYFSTSTITTLGYGDIVPITNLARIFVSIESILGVLFIGLFLNSLSGPKPIREFKADTSTKRE